MLFNKNSLKKNFVSTRKCYGNYNAVNAIPWIENQLGRLLTRLP